MTMASESRDTVELGDAEIEPIHSFDDPTAPLTHEMVDLRQKLLDD